MRILNYEQFIDIFCCCLFFFVNRPYFKTIEVGESPSCVTRSSVA